MKRILSLILAIGMLFTMAPVSIMAQDVLATAKTGASAYEAKVGETISVPFQIVPTSGELSTDIVSAGILVPEGLTYTVTAGIAQPADDENVFVLDPDMINIWYEASAKFTAESNTLCTVNFTATKAGEYNVGFDPEFVDLLDGSLNPLASAYDGNIVTQGAKLTFEADRPVSEFEKFKEKAVYFDADEHYEVENGSGLSTSWNSKDTANSFYLWDLSNEEEVAAMKAHTSYESQKANLEANISKNNAKWATLVSGDSGYKFTNKDGVPALFTTVAATGRATDNWCRYTAMNFYFKATDKFTDADKNLTFVMEYLDEGTANIAFKYTNQEFVNGSDAAKTSTVSFPRTNTGEWVVKAVSVENAKLTPGLTKTALQDGSKTIKIGCGSADTYINAIAVLKTSDYNEIMGIVPEEPDLPEDPAKEAKYAEYIFGAKEDKAYGMTSYNVDDNYYTQTKDGLTIRNSIVKFDEPRTFYFVADDKTSTSDTAASHQVTKEEYYAYDGHKKASYNVQYYNTSSNAGDSGCNRYDAVGPDADKRAAIFGTAHLRNDSRLTRRTTNSMIHFDAGSTFSSSDNALVIEVDVLDVGTHTVNLQYCNKAGEVGRVNSAKLTNTGEWITLTYNLTDADFAWTKNTGLGNEKQDFRFQLNVPTYISAVRVYDSEKVDVAEADYTKYALADYDVMINEDNTITAKTAITAEEAADAKLYVAFYDAKGDLVGVATSAQVKDGAAQTLVTGKSVGATYNTVDYTLKTFVWDAELKPLR